VDPWPLAGRTILVTGSTGFIGQPVCRALLESGATARGSSREGGPHPVAGVERVADPLGDRPVVVRTAWVYAANGRNFLSTMLRLLNDRGQVTVISDQIGVLPIATEEYPTPACRPRYSVLDCSATRVALRMAPDHWRVALRRILREPADG
jgi:dTDP-4-dehydrorhamnose reductase